MAAHACGASFPGDENVLKSDGHIGLGCVFSVPGELVFGFFASVVNVIFLPLL